MRSDAVGVVPRAAVRSRGSHASKSQPPDARRRASRSSSRSDSLSPRVSRGSRPWARPQGPPRPASVAGGHRVGQGDAPERSPRALQPLAPKGGKTRVDVLVLLAKGSPKPASLQYAVRVRLKAPRRSRRLRGQGRAESAHQARDLARACGSWRTTAPASLRPSPASRAPDTAGSSAARAAKTAQLVEATTSGVVKAWAKGFGKDGRRQAGRGDSHPRPSPRAAARRACSGCSAGGPAPSPSGPKYSDGLVRRPREPPLDRSPGRRATPARACAWPSPTRASTSRIPTCRAPRPPSPRTPPRTPAGRSPSTRPRCYALAIDQTYGTTYVAGRARPGSPTPTATVAAGACRRVRRAHLQDGLDLDAQQVGRDAHRLSQRRRTLTGMGPDPDYYPKPAVLVVDANTSGRLRHRVRGPQLQPGLQRRQAVHEGRRRRAHLVPGLLGLGGAGALPGRLRGHLRRHGLLDRRRPRRRLPATSWSSVR